MSDPSTLQQIRERLGASALSALAGDLDQCANGLQAALALLTEIEQVWATNPKRYCHDCGEVFEWHHVDDVGRCGRCYERLVRGLPRLNPTPAPHPDRRYVSAASLAETQARLTALEQEWRKEGEELRAVARGRGGESGSYALGRATGLAEAANALAPLLPSPSPEDPS